VSTIEAVHVLRAGHCLHPHAMTMRGASWKPHRFDSGFGAIVDRTRGALLFDTGYAPRFVAATTHFPERAYALLTPVHVTPAETAAAQLAHLGIAPGDVRDVVVSHFHADHIAGLRDFPRARVWTSRAAWESVRGRSGIAALRRGHLAALLPDDVEARLAFVDDRPAVSAPSALAAFGDARDLFGDGSLLALSLPGHAAGHIGIVLPEAPGGPWFFIGDAAWSLAAIARDRPPPRLTTALLGRTGLYRATLRKLHRLALAAPELRIVPAHDVP
jgi:glyoxylase-like metal-dependent hydrolase (beta-lactamase superfamily II)